MRAVVTLKVHLAALTIDHCEFCDDKIPIFYRLDGNTRILTLSQEKFNADGSSTAGALWNIPIKILKSNKEVIEVLMDQKELIVKLEDVQEQDWFKVNPDYFGNFTI